MHQKNILSIEKIRSILWHTASAALIAAGQTLLASYALQIQNSTAVILSCLAACLYLSAADCLLHGWKKLAALALPFLAAAAAAALRLPAAVSCVQAAKAALLRMRGADGGLLLYQTEALCLLSVFLSMLSCLYTRDAVFPLTVICAAIFCIPPFLAAQESEMLPFLIPVTAGTLIILSGRSGKKLSALLIAAVLALSAFFVLPRALPVQPALEKAARTLRDYSEDYLSFNRERTAFSLITTGFQPLGNRLGGPAEPSGTPVMEISGEARQKIYLRGAVYSTYTGLTWIDTLSVSRRLFANPFTSAFRDRIFDMNRVQASPSHVRVRMLRHDTTTVFVPQRLLSWRGEGERMVPYFNEGSELFITRELERGDVYEATYLRLDPSDPETERLIAQGKEKKDDRAGELEPYTAVPEHIQSEVRALAAEITSGITDPYRRAQAIRDWLRENCAYRLDVEEPPENTDFAAYFLLFSREGYCTYFATAMTLLCRIAGIPARYVAGYTAQTDENGQCTVTGKNAHAWTEIYMNGFGWMTLDATPGDGGDAGENGGGNDRRQESDTAPSPTPSPTPTPTPSAPNEGSEAENPDEDPDREPEEAETTPTPEPETNVSPDPSARDRQNAASSLPFFAILLVLLLLLLFRIRQSDPERRARRHPEKAALILYAASVRVLRAAGLEKSGTETWLEFGKRAAAVFPQIPESHFEAIAGMIYSRGQKGSEPDARNLYRKACSAVPRRAKLRAVLTRVFDFKRPFLEP